MIVRNVEKPGSRKHRDTKEGNEYEYTLTLVSNSANDNEYTIKTTPGVPRRGNPFVRYNMVDAIAKCSDISVEHLGRITYRGQPAWHWEVQCRFTSEFAGKPPEDKLLWPTEIHWSPRKVSVISKYDAEGKPIVNSAGDFMRDLPQQTLSHALLSLTRVERSYNAVVALSYADKVNSMQWFACPAGTAKAEMPDGVLFYDEIGKRYLWRVTYNFEIAPEGWLPGKYRQLGNPSWLDDTGMEYWATKGAGITSEWVKVAVTDDFGKPASEPKFLNGKGGLLAADAKEPVYLPFKFFRTANFAALRLP